MDGLNRAIGSRDKFTVQEVEELKKYRDRIMTLGPGLKGAEQKASSKDSVNPVRKGQYPHSLTNLIAMNVHNPPQREIVEEILFFAIIF